MSDMPQGQSGGPPFCTGCGASLSVWAGSPKVRRRLLFIHTPRSLVRVQFFNDSALKPIRRLPLENRHILAGVIGQSLPISRYDSDLGLAQQMRKVHHS